MYVHRCFSCCTDGTAAVLLCTITIVTKVREEGLFGARLQYTAAAAFDIHRVQHILSYEGNYLMFDMHPDRLTDLYMMQNRT